VHFAANILREAAAMTRLISHPAVRRVNFTGSTRVGRILAQIAAKYLKPILLELGGKAPLVVLDDADVDAAVAATVFGAFANAGQICKGVGLRPFRRQEGHRRVHRAALDHGPDRARHYPF
jgi:benzaldehyde dehydrogenase (NAD)